MRRWPALLLLLPLAAAAQTGGSDGNGRALDRSGEIRLSLPQYPKPENYLPFDVSATTPFAFFVDANSISVGPDSEVRYTLIAKSSGGALNISFEGMRCTDGRYRVYAIGSVGNGWFESRNSKWKNIPADSRNAQRTVLYKDYFCPPTGNMSSAAEAVRALKSGGSSQAAKERF